MSTGMRRYLKKRQLSQKNPVGGGVLEMRASHQQPLETMPAHITEEQVTEDEIYEDEAEAPSSILGYHIDRLGVEQEKAEANLRSFADFVMQVESDGNPQAENKDTSATGAFQFVKNSVLPALNRMEKTGGLPEWADNLKEIYKGGISEEEHREAIKALPVEQQTELFLADILEKKIDSRVGYGDELIKRVVEGDKEAMKELYFKGHHTAPDEATTRRVQEVMSWQ